MQFAPQATTALRFLSLGLTAQVTLGAPIADAATSPNPGHEVKKREYYLNCSFGMLYICESRGTICLNDDYPWSPDRWCAANCECVYVRDCCTVVRPGEHDGQEGGDLEQGKDIEMGNKSVAAEAK
jgi:hypothetical protein